MNSLDLDVRVPFGAVEVEVDDGWVTLRGGVDWGYERSAAEAAVRNIEGVTGISNLISLHSALTTGRLG